MLRLNLRYRDIGTDSLTWFELEALIMSLAGDRTSALHKKLNPNYEWTPELHMLANIFDAQNIAIYVAEAAAGGKPKKPKPIVRGVQKHDAKPEDSMRALQMGIAGSMQVHGTAIEIDELNEKFGLGSDFADIQL